MKKFFLSIKDWFARHIPTKRRLIQVYTALLYNANLKGFVKGEIYQGNTKYACVPGMNCYSCPGAVGSCPLGSLQNAFAQSGTSAPYYIIGIIGLFGLIFARTVCGFLCPVGLCQELLHKIPTPKLKKSRFTRVLSYLKYVLLAVLVLAVPILYGLQGIAVPGFCKYVCPAGTFEGGLGLLLNPANWTGSRNLLSMLGPIFTWKFALLCAIIVACVVMYRPFCRFLCPLGAIYGFFNKIAFFGVKVDKIKCTDCGLCVKHCEMDVKHVGDHECIHCGKCIKVCPVKAISWKCSNLFDKKDDNQEEQPVSKTPEPVTAESEAAVTEAVAVGAGVGQIEVTSSPVGMATNAKYTVVLPPAEVGDGNDADHATPPAEAPPTPPDKVKRKRSPAFWAQLAAWCTAFVVLIGSILYFNVFTKSDDIVDVLIGQECPDFSLQRYGAGSNGRYTLLEEEFAIKDQLGSVVVVNFWATWCGPCIAEIPHFNRVATEHPEIKVVAIHGIADTKWPAATFISSSTADGKTESWRDYNIIFLQDIIENKVCQTFKTMGGGATWPMTLIVGKDGKITFTRQGSLTYEKLTEEVENALNAEYTENT